MNVLLFLVLLLVICVTCIMYIYLSLIFHHRELMFFGYFLSCSHLVSLLGSLTFLCFCFLLEFFIFWPYMDLIYHIIDIFPYLLLNHLLRIDSTHLHYSQRQFLCSDPEWTGLEPPMWLSFWGLCSLNFLVSFTIFYYQYLTLPWLPSILLICP